MSTNDKNEPRLRLSREAWQALIERARSEGKDPNDLLHEIVTGVPPTKPSQGDGAAAGPAELKAMADEDAAADAAVGDDKVAPATETNPLRRWAGTETEWKGAGRDGEDAKQKKRVEEQRRVATQGRRQR